MSGATLAEGLGITQPHWSKIENGKAKLAPEQLRRAVELLDIPADDAQEPEKLRQRAEEQGWWQEFGDLLAEPVKMLIELEASAERILTYDGAVVPGLLQVRRYADRIISGSSPHLRVGEIDRYLELRMRRQRRLDDGTTLRAVMSEAAVRQQIGGREVYLEQLRHLVTVTRTKNVSVQVVPFTADAHAALTDNFVIIEWPDEADPQAVYVDGQTSWAVHERAGLIRQYLHSFASVQTAALPVRESLVLIERLIKEQE